MFPWQKGGSRAADAPCASLTRGMSQDLENALVLQPPTPSHVGGSPATDKEGEAGKGFETAASSRLVSLPAAAWLGGLMAADTVASYLGGSCVVAEGLGQARVQLYNGLRVRIGIHSGRWLSEAGCAFACWTGMPACVWQGDQQAGMMHAYTTEETIILSAAEPPCFCRH